MATAAHENYDALICTVCLDTYTDPCTLQCKHIFCRRCITDYVKTQADAIQNKTIPCPSCRQVTRVPDPSRPVDEWAMQLHPGHVIQELMMNVNPNTTVEETYCSPCQHLGKTNPAKFWCAECEEAYCQGCASTHSVLAISRDHELCDIKDKGQPSRRKRKCKEHKDQLLQLYCKTCNRLHCQLCFVDNHRKCDKVVTIKSFMTDIKGELSDLNNQIREQENKFESQVHRQRTRISQLNRDKKTAIDDISCACQKAVAVIKAKEKQLIDQIEEISERDNNELKAQVKLGNIQLQTYRQYGEYINQVVNSDSEVEVCDVYQVWKSGRLDINQERVKENGRESISSVMFFKEKQNMTQVLDSLQLGEILTTYLPTDSQSSPLLIESVDSRMPEDTKDPSLHDVTVLEVGGVYTVVVTDLNNICVKSFYTKSNKKFQSRLQFYSKPYGITHLGDTNLMLAVPESRQIVTVAVTPDLAHVNVINTSERYFSLAAMSNSRLAAGGYNHVDILNMQGEVMKTITTHNSMGLFQYSDYMCVSNTEHLLVSDLGNETVTCKTSEGQVVWIYSGGKERQRSYPRGITTTRGGDILFADSSLKKVIQLSVKGEYVRDVLTSKDGLSYPCGICVDKHGVFYICDSGKILKFVFIRK